MNRRTFLSNVLAASTNLAVLNRSSLGQTSSKQRSKDIDYSPVVGRFRERLPGLMAQYKIPGMAIALIDSGRVVWSEGFGYTDQTQKVKVTDESLFSIQSVSKTYTALGVLLGVSKGRLKLDDSVGKFLPAFTVKSRIGGMPARRITIRHLLSHWSGLCHEAPVGNNFDDRPCTFEEHIRSISDTWLMAPVGSRFSYSNLGIDLAGHILQLRSGTSFETFMRKEVFAPLGMTGSTFDQNVARTNAGFAKGHRAESELSVYSIPMIPAGGMYSSVKDLAQFVIFCLRGAPLVSNSLFTEMAQPQFAVTGQIGGYGLGLYKVASFGATKLLHSGGGYGYSADQRWIPEYGIGAVAVMNQQRGLAASSLTNSALELMIKTKYGEVPRNKPASLTNQSIVSLAPESMKRFEGTYKGGGLVSFEVKDGNLFQVIGNEKQKLDALGPTTFISGPRKYSFELDKRGKPQGVQVIDPGYSGNGVEYWSINDTPTDERGPFQEEWSKYVGQYRGSSYGSSVETNISTKNGYLYTSWSGGLKLKHYRDNVFFDTEGEAVIFQGDRMSLGNRPFVKS